MGQNNSRIDGDELETEKSKQELEGSQYSIGSPRPRPGAPRVGDPASGVGIYQYPVELLEPLRDLYESLEEVYQEQARAKKAMWNLFDGCKGHPSQTESPPDILKVGPYSFRPVDAEYVENDEDGAGITWIYAIDEKTLELFDPLFEACVQSGFQPGPPAAGPLKLWSAFYIVVRSNKFENPLWHTDHDVQIHIPGFAFSALTPVYDLPEGTCGLEFCPWTEPYNPNSAIHDECRRNQYRPGELVVMDGSLLHRTEPYHLEDEDPSFVRVLICLDVHSEAPLPAALEAKDNIANVHQAGLGYYRRNKLAEAEGLDGPIDGDDDAESEDETVGCW